MARGEAFRGSVHALTGSLAFCMAAWNLMTYGERGGRRHILNAALYTGLWLYEGYNTRRHWAAEDAPEMLGIGA